MIVPPRYDSADTYQGELAGEPSPPPYSPPPYEDDEDYDVYYYWPSLSPYILVPVTKSQEGELDEQPRREQTTTNKKSAPQQTPSPQTPPTVTRAVQTVDELASSQSLDSPLSPKDSFASNITFPEHSVGGMDEVGYSKLFRAGLVAESPPSARHFDTVGDKIRQLFRSSKMVASGSR